jgi:hypothetical protein
MSGSPPLLLVRTVFGSSTLRNFDVRAVWFTLQAIQDPEELDRLLKPSNQLIIFRFT